MTSDFPLFPRRNRHFAICFLTVILAGLTLLSASTGTGTNLYAPYPQISNVSTSMSWPSGQAVPTFATPAVPLDTILVQDLSPDEEITFSALQGLINKSKPRVYLLDSGADAGLAALQALHADSSPGSSSSSRRREFTDYCLAGVRFNRKNSAAAGWRSQDIFPMCPE